MTAYNYLFLYKREPTVLQSDDIATANTIVKTLSFVRNNIPIFLKFGKNKIYDKNLNANNASKIIRNISGITPVANTNDNGDILVFKLSGKTKEDKEVSK